MGRQRKTVIGTYQCGCGYGPVWIQDRPKYCGKHGDDIQSEYDVNSLPEERKQLELKTLKYKEPDEDRPKFEGQLFQDVTDSPIEKIILSGVKHYKNKFNVIMKYVLVHREAMKENEVIIKDKDYGDIIVRKDGHIGRTYFWFFSSEPPEPNK